MTRQNLSRAASKLLSALCIAALAFASLTPASAQIETVIHSFQSNGPIDGSFPAGPLFPDHTGALYGTTTQGGKYSCGTVFKLTPPTTQGGAWSQNILYAFATGKGGCYPIGNLAIGRTGKIYGTTQAAGGSTSAGVIYELTPPAKLGSPWTETVLYTFTGGNDGGDPYNGVIADGAGKLYGTTFEGGRSNGGVAFRLSPPAQSGGAWTLAVLYSFQHQPGHDTEPPYPSGLVLDTAGALYGATAGQSEENVGTVFQLTPPSGGKGAWTENVLYAFTGNADGGAPFGGLVFDSNGALYGTAEVGGSGFSGGTVYKLTPPAAPSGAWTESVLYSFVQGTGDGYYPFGTLAWDSSGALYGVTESGGIQSCGGNDTGCGTVFKLNPPSTQGGAWTEQILHSFADGGDGTNPAAPVAVVGTTVYGTTIWGGAGTCQSEHETVGCGTVFEVTQ